MAMDKHQLNQWINSPRESLSLELKDWIDPDTEEGKAKIVKTILAMRNNDGGLLLIGFNNNDGSPNPENAPENVEEVFHIDKLQGLTTKYASEGFEIVVYYPELENTKYIVIEIPSGVKNPVATKSGLENAGQHYIKAHTVYVRSLNSNNTPSTTEAKWKDWPSITEKCLENREADVGRFIRRHLSSVASSELNEVFMSLFTNVKKHEEPVSEKLVEFINSSFTRFETIVAERSLNLPEHGSMEVGAIVGGSVGEYSTNNDFINLIGSTNPRYTGWPVWTDSRSFTDENSRPFVFDGAWEALIASFDSGWSDHLDYWRICPNGMFYLYRGFQDDIGRNDMSPQAGTALDFGLAILRTAECIAVALEFAKAMGSKDDVLLHFIFRWKGLQGRILNSWAQPERSLSYDRTAYQAEVLTVIDVPLDTAKTAISGYVHQVISRLFEVFDGFVLSEKITDDLVRRLLERKL